MYIVQDWEMFYTTSKEDIDLVDQISIDIKNKRFILDLNADTIATDGYDRDDNPINSMSVSRFIFDIIVAAIREKGFVEYIQA